MKHTTLAHRHGASFEPSVAPGFLLQRKCACGNHTMSGACDECAQKESSLQRKTSTHGEPSEVPPIVNDVLRSPGSSLDTSTREFFESRFDHDFSGVRVHADSNAARSAEAVNALAYTVGRDIVFGAGRYSPGTSAGRSLMAHELTHVAQQRSGGASTGPLVIGSTDANEEREASSAETIVNAGGAYNGLSPANQPRVLRRAPPSGTTPPTSNPTFACLQDGT